MLIPKIEWRFHPMRHSNGERARPSLTAGQMPPGARTWTRWKRLIVIPALLVLVDGAVKGAIAETPVETPEAPAYVGSAGCSACHAEQVAAWRESHHGWALRVADDENILGDFDDATFVHEGLRSRFFRESGKAFVETEGRDGALGAHEIKYTVGVEPLQQYLVELDGGRLQALDIAWDTEAKRWFHLYPGATERPGEGLHWTGPYKNWQARCAVCHQTGFEKGYDPRSKTYQSRWSELTVGCEACHGPAGQHVEWASKQDPSAPDAGASGLAVAFPPGKDGAKAEIAVCAACHSRRAPFGGDTAPPGAPFADHYNLSLLRDGLYHADGQIDDEVYVLGSFLQSKMYAEGVRCSNCHDVHTAELRADGDAICTQCHNPEGRDEFPTLPKAAFDDPEHHHHPPESAGARCVACHMPAKRYMIVDPRRDHSFRVPRPDLGVKIGTPDACTGCHDDKSAAWAAESVEAWYPEGRWRRLHFGEVLHGGRTRSDDATTEALIALAGDGARPAIVRASAIQLLGLRLDQNVGGALAPFLGDGEALVRTAAVDALGAAPRSVRARLVAPSMTDPVRAVRLAAARATVDIPLTGLTAEERQVVERARTDLRSSILALADYPEMQMQIGGLAMTLRNLRAADAAFQEAVRMDPGLIDAWMSRTRLALAQDDARGAAAILGEALEHNPDSALLRQSRGNVMVDLGRLQTSLEDLNEAARLAPGDPVIRIDLASVHVLRGENALALKALMAARLGGADGPDVLDLLAVVYSRLDRLDRAQETARDLARRFPDYERRPEVDALLQDLD
jgi:predicted CXXCH cytochrome family protein